MDLLKEITLSIRSYSEAIKFIDKFKLWKLLIIPAICALIIAAFVTWFALKTSDNVTQFAVIKFKLDSEYSYMNSFLEFVVMFFIKAVILFSYVKLFRYLIIIILAPATPSIRVVLTSTDPVKFIKGTLDKTNEPL